MESEVQLSHINNEAGTKSDPVTSSKSSIEVHTVYDPHENGRTVEGQEFDIIALQGEHGDWRETWTSKDGNYFWLADAIPKKFPNARVISCTHGGVRDNGIENLLQSLIDDRTRNGRHNIPIIIIGNGLGGNLAKQLLIASSPFRNSSEKMNQFHSKIKAFMFFATIHRHGPAEKLPATLNTTLKMMSHLSPVLSTKPKSNLAAGGTIYDQLPLINQDFESFGGERIPTVCFYETQQTRKWLPKSSLNDLNNKLEKASTMPRAENLPIDSSHSALTKFSGPEDPSLQSVLDALGRLMLKAERLPDHTHLSKTQPQDPSDGLRVLALDGGGVKGLFSILVLEAVMEAVQQIDAPEASELPKPCEYFNLICGTSTGGLLAIMLGRLQMDIRACKQAYRDLSRGIFEKTVWEFPGTKWIDALLNKPWYSAEKLEIAIKGILSQHLSSDEKKDLGARKVPVGDAPLHPSHDLITRCFVCALPDSKRQCDRLRTYIPAGDDEPPALKIWEVGRATSAAPLYFPPITICGTKYFDGGMQSNNPILEATREANKEYSTKSVAAMVSIGTGSREPPSQGGGLINLIKSMVSRVTDTEAKDQDFKDFFPGLKDVYFRLQERTHLGSIDLAAWEKLDEIEELANGYLKSAEGQAQVRSCAEKIARGEVGAEEIAA